MRAMEVVVDLTVRDVRSTSRRDVQPSKALSSDVPASTPW